MWCWTSRDKPKKKIQDVRQGCQSNFEWVNHIYNIGVRFPLKILVAKG